MTLRLVRSEKGTAVVEFALVAPILIFLFMGVVDVGRYCYYGIVTAHAAASGVQFGSQNVITALNGTGMQSATLQDAASLPNATVSTQHFCSLNGAVASCGTGGSGLTYYVKVQITGTYSPIFPYPGIPQSVPITATAVMRVAGQ